MVPICMDVLDCYSEDQRIKYFSLYTVDYRHLNRSKRKRSPSSIISVYNGVLPSPFTGSTLVELHLDSADRGSSRGPRELPSCVFNFPNSHQQTISITALQG